MNYSYTDSPLHHYTQNVINNLNNLSLPAAIVIASLIIAVGLILNGLWRR